MKEHEEILEGEQPIEHPHERKHPPHLAPELPEPRATLSLSVTPAKLFWSGFLVGILLMGIPTAFLASQIKTLVAKAGTVAVAPVTDPAAQPPAAQLTGKPELFDTDHRLGDKNAELTIIEYSDLECPFCKRFHPTVNQVVNDYKGKVSLVYRHFPLSFHANARKEAEASECAAEVGGDKKFFEYIDTIYERTTSNGTGFALDQLVPLAKELGINEGKFKTCLDSGKMATRVNDDFTSGQSLGIDGTPGNILLTKSGKTALVPGAVDATELKSEIDRLLKS